MKKRNYKPAIITLSIILIGAIGILAGMPGYEDFDAFDVTILPLMNAIFNSFTFLFLVCALIAILKRKITIHRRFIYAAFVTTFLFLITYVAFLYLAPSTPYCCDCFFSGSYYFVFITTILFVTYFCTVH